MSKTTVVVLGASGMLGSMVVDVLSRDEKLQVIATVRSEELARRAAQRIGEVDWRVFNITHDLDTARQLTDLGEAQWFVNAIGLTKPYTHDDNPMEIERAIVGNALFPHILARVAGASGGRVLQIATDCVYSGTKGRYIESDKHDALDVYGKTKSLGEALLPNMHCLRCSIIGPEPKVYAFLLEWFRRQSPGATVSGFTNHAWNGVTTLHYARVCHGIICSGLDLPHLQHIIPSGEISKYELLRCFSRAYQRTDIAINATEASYTIDRTLQTENQALNEKIWQLAGYPECPPTLPQMVEEMAQFDYRFTGLAA